MTPASFHGDAEWYRGKGRRPEGPVAELGAGTRRLVRHLPLELRLFGATWLEVSSDRGAALIRPVARYESDVMLVDGIR